MNKLQKSSDERKKAVKTITLGCRFNFYESEVAKSIITNLEPNSDIVVINTCSVTHEAERQSRQFVRKAIRENKGAKIIVTGCAAKTSFDYFKNLEGVFKVVQNDEKDNIEPYLDIPHNSDKIKPLANGEDFFQGRVRAFLEIQNGCNHFCAYCIVPFTRGRSRSFPIEEILKKVGSFIKSGIKEITLSGIDITSYGLDIGGNIELADVIESIFKTYPDFKRLRISSVDPAAISDRLLNLFINEKRILPHFHLSIQSGDNDVLKAMRRRHTREDVIKICRKIKEARKEAVFGCDLLVGFPTETKEMFQNTLTLIDEANLSLAHAFAYSLRPGTVAASMIQHPRDVILKRGKLLRKKAKEARLKLFSSLVGTNMPVIIESSKDGVFYGKTDSFIPFRTSLKGFQSGDVVQLKVFDFDSEMLIM
ncbi:MAG: tRNA (N(6)-L-threonylcarbamoyladenosine(37)-C(2))-methylthiotransferase MtaB [Holosporales bacterium]|jgi:threonylcarbamoyladenosine tRNA methylthiotransferase MtaB|nr:tRNA (N(6)-L-threonylcarbamoyladenosine(37)-C(2))-methylthiotransferase MtaB [Holosporales bacterium]